MAEFTEVCRQAMRMNEAFCTERGREPIAIELLISAAGYVVFKNEGKSGTAEEIERFIMEWAAEHPEPAYPN